MTTNLRTVVKQLATVAVWSCALAGIGAEPRHARADTITYAGGGNQIWENNDADGDWTGGDGIYADGDDVIFTDTGFGTVTISGSRAPASIIFSNSLLFTFQTGNLNNAGSLTMSGGGDVTFSTVSMLPVLGDVVINSGTLNYNNSERIGSLSGSGTLNGTVGNNVLRYGWNNASTTFSGNVTQAGGNPSVPSFDKVGKGTTTITSAIGALGSGGVGVTDGTLRFVDGGAIANAVSTTVYNGARLINDDTGTHVDNRTQNPSIGGEYVVLGSSTANSAIGGNSNNPFHFNQLGNPTLTLVPGAGFEAQYRQRNGGNSGTFGIINGVVALVRGDGLAQTSGTRSRFTIRDNALNTYLIGGAGTNLPTWVGGGQNTPQVSVLYRAYGDDSSTGLGAGFVTYQPSGSAGTAADQTDADRGVRLLTANEYATTIADGDGAVVSTVANTRLSTAVAGIDGATRINSLLLEQGGSVSGAGTLTVHSGLIMSTGGNGAITTAGLDVPALANNSQLSLITPAADDQLTISSVITGTGGLVKVGAGTAILTGANGYSGTTFIANGALSAIDGVGLPGNSTLHFTGGVFESSGVFSRSLGTGATDVRWDEFSSGGFAARGGTLGVQLNGNTGQVTWDNTANFVQGHRHLILGSATADNVVDFQNALSLGTFDAAAGDRSDSTFRTIEVRDNPNSGADLARISGAISGADARLSLQKIGAGVLELSGANTYIGQTLVEEGTLLITGTTSGQGSYFVSDGATLGGTGTIGLGPAASVEIANGGTLAPGMAGVGTLTIDGDLVLNPDSIIAVDLFAVDAIGSPNDLIAVLGDVTLDGVLDVSDISSLGMGSFPFLTYTGELVNNGLLTNNARYLIDTSIAGQVSLVHVPEPSTLLLVGAGMFGLAIHRRRRLAKA